MRALAPRQRYGVPRPPIAIRPSAVGCRYVYAWAAAIIVSQPCHPISSQADAGSGSVAIIDELIGATTPPGV